MVNRQIIFIHLVFSESFKMAMYKGAAKEAGRALNLIKKRQKEQQELEERKKKIEEEMAIGNINNKFATHYDAVEQRLKSDTIGMLSQQFQTFFGLNHCTTADVLTQLLLIAGCFDYQTLHDSIHHSQNIKTKAVMLKRICNGLINLICCSLLKNTVKMRTKYDIM